MPANQPKGATTPQDVLRYAKDLIATKGWTQGMLAKNARGKSVTPTSPNATGFCVVGAMWCADVALVPTEAVAKLAWDSLYLALPEGNERLASWQDSLPYTEEGKQKVLGFFDAAIASLEVTA